MLIALHRTHHTLPFWHNPQQAKEVFDPERHGQRELTFRDGPVPVKETWIWPLLKGLHDVEMPVMAHVSAFCNCGDEGTWHFPKRIWVQITTLPTEKDDQGVPVTIRGEERTVKGLWGYDNGTYTPYEFLDKENQKFDKSKHTAEFWRNFFVEKMRAVRADAQEEAVGAREKAVAAKEWSTKLSAIIP